MVHDDGQAALLALALEVLTSVQGCAILDLHQAKKHDLQPAGDQGGGRGSKNTLAVNVELLLQGPLTVRV